MENKVGDNVPSQKKLDELQAKLAGVLEELQKFLVTLHADERASTLKPHKGAATLAERVHDMAARYDIQVKNVPLEGMKNDLRLAAQVKPFEAMFALGAQLTADTLLQANHEYYTAFLAYYGALCRAADHDSALAAEIKDIQDEMRKVRKSRSAPAGNTPPGSGTPTP